MHLTYESIAKRIDHALLTPTMTDAEMLEGCQLAARYEVASVCIKPYAVPLAVTALSDSTVAVGTVIGFPHGGQSTASKVAEAVEAMESGATEIDIVVNIGAVLSGQWEDVHREIKQLTRTARERAALIKVIFETCYLDESQKIKLCQLCSEVGVDYVKTSTGFGTGGATSNDLILMRKHTDPSVKLKASGGIRDLSTVIAMCELGVERLGLSRTSEILEELIQQLGLPNRLILAETKAVRSPSENY